VPTGTQDWNTNLLVLGDFNLNRLNSLVSKRPGSQHGSQPTILPGRVQTWTDSAERDKTQQDVLLATRNEYVWGRFPKAALRCFS
jgi:hypothetical protein